MKVRISGGRPTPRPRQIEANVNLGDVFQTIGHLAFGDMGAKVATDVYEAYREQPFEPYTQLSGRTCNTCRPKVFLYRSANGIVLCLQCAYQYSHEGPDQLNLTIEPERFLPTKKSRRQSRRKKVGHRALEGETKENSRAFKVDLLKSDKPHEQPRPRTRPRVNPFRPQPTPPAPPPPTPVEVTAAYRTLGLAKSASRTDVKRRRRTLAKTHHTDRGGDPNKMQEINTAADLLLTYLDTASQTR